MIEYGDPAGNCGPLVYATFETAAAALCRFLEAYKLPIPDIRDAAGGAAAGVGCGRITCSWRLSEALPSDVWEKAARRLQRRCGPGLWADAVGDLAHPGQLLVEGDGVDPRTVLAVRPRRPRR
jgi:hypothetical protein